jgi:Domain of unknown function (DUF4214)
MDQRARISAPSIREIRADEFGSLSLGRAYIDSLREGISSVCGPELIEALDRLDRAYDEFPELELDRPRSELLEGLRSAAENMPDRAAIPLLMYCVSARPSCSSLQASLVERITKSEYWPSLPTVLHSLCRCEGVCWPAMEPILAVLQQQGRAETALQLISGVLDCIKVTNEESVSKFGEILKWLSNAQQPLGIDSAALARAVQSARYRLRQPPSRRNERGSAAVRLAMAERLRFTPSPARPNLHCNLGWPSGRMSFGEFLLQWPCEIELPADLDEAAFIEEAYRAILLRGPDAAEKDQYLRLLQNRVVSKSWIIEDLLASTELHSLERQLRVVLGGQVISEPGSSSGDDMPAVTWPWWSAS